jgi:hypothetical protein
MEIFCLSGCARAANDADEPCRDVEPPKLLNAKDQRRHLQTKDP